MAVAKANGMQVDRAQDVDLLADFDPWAATPLANTRPTDGTSRNWPGWHLGSDLLRRDLPGFQVAPPKAQCVSLSTPGSTATSRSSSLASHRGEGSLSSSEGYRRKHSEPAPLSKADLVSTMGEFQNCVMQQIKQQSDLLLFQIGK
eukprot:4520987-Karenia_brevis.AAC.1